MKRTIALLILALAITVSAAARDRVTRNVNELPQTAQLMLKKHFGKNKVNHIKIERKTFGGAEYDVILDNGTEIEFDSNGNWTEIDTGTSAVPSGLVLKSIRDYVKTNFKGAKIVSINVQRNKYEIDLSTGVDLEFDRNGTFLRID